MNSVYNYVVEPLGERYNNTKKVGDKELILNTEVYNHQHVNREAKVLSTPRISNSDIQPGDIVTVHHNIFRRWHDVKGRERNSSSFLEEGRYLVAPDQQLTYCEKFSIRWGNSLDLRCLPIFLRNGIEQMLLPGRDMKHY